MRQYTEAFGRISGLHARAVRTWKSGAFFVEALCLTATCSVFGYCRVEYGKIGFSGR